MSKFVLFFFFSLRHSKLFLECIKLEPSTINVQQSPSEIDKSAFVGDTMSMTLNCLFKTTWQKLLLNMATTKKVPIKSVFFFYVSLIFGIELNWIVWHKSGRQNAKCSKRKQSECVYECRLTQLLRWTLLMMHSNEIVRDKWFLTRNFFFHQ